MRNRVLAALGNTFAVTPIEAGHDLREDDAIAICKQASADGLITLARPIESAPNRLSARVWNKDGSDGGFSANGLRCAACAHSIDRQREWGIYDIECAGRLHPVKVSSRPGAWDAEIEIGGVSFTLDEIPVDPSRLDAIRKDNHGIGIQVAGLIGHAVSVGNPHFVLFGDLPPTPDLATAAAQQVGASGAFPEGVNVQLVRVEHESQIQLTTFERGVGVTSACGSGAVAAIAVSRYLKLVHEQVVVRMQGGDALVTATPGVFSLKSTIDAKGESEL